jgi:hypothetical protein
MAYKGASFHIVCDELYVICDEFWVFMSWFVWNLIMNYLCNNHERFLWSNIKNYLDFICVSRIIYVWVSFTRMFGIVKYRARIFHHPKKHVCLFYCHLKLLPKTWWPENLQNIKSGAFF